MDSDKAELLELLAENGFVLVRQRKHEIYRNAKGQIWVTPATASDSHAFKNNLAQFRNFLERGMVKNQFRPPNISQLERRLAEDLLHPQKPRQERQVKERRFVQKPLRLPAQPQPTIAREKKRNGATPRFDDYKIGSIIRLTLQSALGTAWPIVVERVVLARKKASFERQDAMKAEGASEFEIDEYARRERDRAKTWAYQYQYALPGIIHSTTRVLQRAIKEGKTPETHGQEITAAVKQCFERKLSGSFDETTNWIMKLLSSSIRS